MDLSNYEISFNKDNHNILEFHENGKLIHNICCPPVKDGCDIIGFDEEIHTGYQHKFEGIIVLTYNHKRSAYSNGKLLCKI